MEKKKKLKARQANRPKAPQTPPQTGFPSKEPPTSKLLKVFTPPPRLLLILILVAGLLASAVVHLSHLGTWQKNKKRFTYDDNVPLMTTLDAYYYLRLVSDYSLGRYGDTDEQRPASKMPRPVPLLVSMTAFLHKVSQLSIEKIAFYLPPLLGALMAVVYLLWGYGIGSPPTALIASLTGASSYYWYTRTCLGRFDTDCLNPFFVFLMTYAIFRFAVEPRKKRFVYLGLSLLAAGLLGLWWPQTRYLGFALILSCYCLSFFLPSSRLERTVKICLLILGSVFVLCFFLGLHNWFPNPLAQVLKAGGALFRMIAKETSSAFPNVGQSISELESPPIMEIVEKVGGHWIPFALSALGLVFLAVRRPDVAVFLSSGFVLGLCSLFSRRFLIFLVPLYAIGLGYFLGGVVPENRVFRKLRGPVLKYGLIALLTVALNAPGFTRSLTQHRLPPFTVSEVTLAKSIPKETGPSPRRIVWAWWDYGYFLQYMTGCKTFIDGGMQSPERTFITAFAMSCEDPVLARNWVRFFSAHDMAGLRRVMTRLGDHATAVAFLKEILAKPQEADGILESHGLTNLDAWKAYLFPEVDASLYVTQDMMNKTYWWYYFGSWDFEEGAGVHPEVLKMNVRDPAALEKQAFLTIGNRQIPLSKVVSVDSHGGTVKDFPSKQAPHIPGAVQAGKAASEEDRIAVVIKGTSGGYLLDEDVYNSLAAGLLFVNPFHTPGFKPLTYHASHGGVWKVE